MKKMDESKRVTVFWMSCLAVMVLVTLLMSFIGHLLPTGVFSFFTVLDAMALFGFAYGMFKKMEERKAERYDELYDNRFYGGSF